jgi:hypothetical protein
MSLDVYLIGEAREEEVTCYACGNTHKENTHEEYFSANITHNLNRMAEAAGIYQHLWRPEEINITQAKELIEPLRKGLEELRANPSKYKKYDATNGWGTYNQFIPWVAQYLQACIDYPEAKVEVSR